MVVRPQLVFQRVDMEAEQKNTENETIEQALQKLKELVNVSFQYTQNTCSPLEFGEFSA